MLIVYIQLTITYTYKANVSKYIRVQRYINTIIHNTMEYYLFGIYYWNDSNANIDIKLRLNFQFESVKDTMVVNVSVVKSQFISSHDV